jgi:two-component system CheB/CheR fusion protein
LANAEEKQNPSDYLVIIGASAGGVEALSILVGTLPLDFPAPIILAQHLDPNRQSTLDHILRRRTQLSITVVTSSNKLEAGHIYVVPANHHIRVRDSHVELEGEHTKRPRPSINVLLSSAAEAYGERLIAVILTGSGSDGAVGAADVKDAGGIVIVQDPQTARYPSMPMALPPTIVDFEVKIEDIGSLLHNLVQGVTIVQSEERTEDTLHTILEIVSHQTSVDFRQYKTSTILRRISRRMAVTHTRTIQDYTEYLSTFPEEVGELLKAFLINVTQFFRDPEAFTYLREEIMPELIAKARGRDKVLRFWAAGCSTGEEPYSLAILLSDMLGSELLGWSIKIFATDLDEAAINFARRGVYSENLLKGISNDYRNRFFERVESGYRISKALRQMVIFGQQDLSHSAPFPRIDLVLCRNVLIYFAPELQDYVLNQFAFSLSPDGYLFLGKAETVRPSQLYLELVNKQWKVYRCVGSVLPSIRRQSLPKFATKQGEGRVVNASNKSMSIQPYEHEPSQTNTDFAQFRRVNELMLRFLPIGVVVIDRHYRVMTTNGSARRLLGLRDVVTDQDFLHAVRGIPYGITREAIDTVFRERNVVTLPEIELDAPSSGNGRYLNLSFAPIQIDTNTSDLLVISVTDVTEQVQIRRQLELAQAEQSQLMSELGTTNKRLSNVNKELMDSNEELQVANEELMLTHEELQASIEEFETTNEELQATNEELETNNEELQATNEELETTNEELRARTNELQEVANTLDSERVRLAEIVALAPFYIMVLLGPRLIVEAYNPNYDRILGNREAYGKPLDEVMELFWNIQLGKTLVRQAHEVYQHNETRTLPRVQMSSSSQEESEENFFVYTLSPSHDSYGRVNGVIIYALDETEQHTHEVRDERAQLKLIFDNTPSALLALYDAANTNLLMASPNYLTMLTRLNGIQPDSNIGNKWLSTTIITPDEQANTLWNVIQESRAPMRLPEVSYTFPRESQETFWDYSLTPIMDTENNSIRFVLVSMIDITEQVLAQRELQRLDSLKDDFLSVTTHELRSPLTAILGNAQVLLRGIKRSATQMGDKDSQRGQLEQWVGMLDRIVNQTNRINAMLSEMMDVTRLSGNVLELHTNENVDVVDVVRRVVEQQRLVDADEHSVVFTPTMDVALGTLDAARIEQVLNNLISNAFKYSPTGTPVTVSMSLMKDEPNTLIVSVRDEGYGINEEEQKYIFDRFYRANSREKVDGLGLGLYIAHRIVTQHEGRVWLESKPGEGSTFYFTLPLS